MDATKRHNTDWLDQWAAAREKAAEPPPKGFYTVIEVAERLRAGLRTATGWLNSEVEAGRMERKIFLIQVGARKMKVAHYRAIAAPSVAKSKALKSRTDQNGSGARRATK